MRAHSRVALASLVFVVGCTTPTALLAIEKDIFTGTCEELATRIKDVGVKDASGSHSNRPGNTASVVEAKGFTHKIIKKTTKGKFFCPANNNFYDTIAECQKPPSAGGCRTVIGTIPCQPRDAEVCLDADATITFSGAHMSTRLEWKTTGQSQACKKDMARWYKDVETHEAKHVKDGRSLVSKWNKDYKKKRFSACGETETQAKANLEAAIADAGDKGSDNLRAAIKEAGETFHNSPAGAPTPRPSCDLCR